MAVLEGLLKTDLDLLHCHDVALAADLCLVDRAVGALTKLFGLLILLHGDVLGGEEGEGEVTAERWKEGLDLGLAPTQSRGAARASGTNGYAGGRRGVYAAVGALWRKSAVAKQVDGKPREGKRGAGASHR